ncbi:MAG TPA: DUF1428 domain-containing protein [Candidatus Thermoplasmatota archaeon]|nr:DUF1428 domain-containing protein [Candidatus Thermoplasmatota archaeon]
MTYVDGFLIPVPKAKMAAYRKFARLGAKIWMEHGALDYKECVADDPFSIYPDANGNWTKVPSQFPRMAGAKRGETVVFSFIVFRSKAHRNAVNKKVLTDPRMANVDPSEMPVDMKRFGYAGFKAFVEG